ncbi:MAG: geranylgeranyl reductase family protein [Actinomycetota bacterium]
MAAVGKGLMSESFDAVIVGGGPGGATAAYWLATFGRKVLVVDRATFPRDKVCGDGLTPRAVKCLIDMGIDTLGPEWSRNDGLRIIGAGTRLELAWPQLSEFPGYGLVRTRLDFDALLLEAARKAGATVWEGTAVTRATTNADGIVDGIEFEREAETPLPGMDRVNGGRRKKVPMATGTVKASVVIACDGASSRIGTAMGGRRLESRPMGVAARTYYRSPRSTDNYLESYLELWRGDDLLPGYGWIFPLPDGTVNVGLGLLNTSPHFRTVDYRRLLNDWVAAMPPEWELSPENQIGGIKSGPLPMGFNRSPIARPGLMLAGDAAGIVNPFNGEGIAYAMETGRIGAEVAHDALAAGDPHALRAYPERLKEAYEGYYILGRAFVKLIGNARIMGGLTKYGLPNERLMRFAFRLLANLTEPSDGSAADRVINALCRIAPPLNVVVGA